MFALGALGTTVFLFVNTLVGGVLTLAAPVLALVLRGRVATEVKAEAKEQGPLAVDRVAALIGPKLDEIIDGFGARLLEFVSQAGDALARGIADVLDQALRERRAGRRPVGRDRRRQAASTRRSRACARSTSASPRSGSGSGRPTGGAADARAGHGRLMGILDRIAGTLDELTGDTDAGAATEVMRAQALAEAGDLDGAEAALRAVTQQFPRYAPGFVALGELDGAARRARGRGDRARAGGRSRTATRAESWYALGDALARLGRTEPARDALRRALTLGLEPSFDARVYAALGRVHARAGEWTAAARALRKALDLAGPGEDDRGIAARLRPRARCSSAIARRPEWLTRAARAPDATRRRVSSRRRRPPPITSGPRRCCARVWRGGRAIERCAAALARRLARAAGRTDEAIALAEACVAEAPDDRRRAGGAARQLRRRRPLERRLARRRRRGRLGAPPPLAGPRRASRSAPRIGAALAALAATPTMAISRCARR